VLVEDLPYQRPGDARLAFETCQAELLYVLWPMNLSLFKSSPHVLEPTSAGQSSEAGSGQTCEPCGLDRADNPGFVALVA